VGWGFAILCAVVLTLALTWRGWIPLAARWALASRGVHVKSIAWSGKDAVKLENVQIKKPGFEARALTVTMLRPWVWKKALTNLNTNDVPVFLTVDGWKVVTQAAGNTDEMDKARRSAARPPPLALRVRAFRARMADLQAKCPRAQLLNGYFQNDGKEFRFGAVEWRDGKLAGDFTWPGLNEPADFKLTSSQLIVRQLALEVGSKINIEEVGRDVRLNGYARWMTNRVDFDLTFPPDENIPLAGFLRSKGIALPGRLFGAPEIEQVAGTVSLVVSNGVFNLKIGEIAPADNVAQPALTP
jgi:hypothetical protein